LGYVELFIICVKFAIYYFLHFDTDRQVAARLRAKSAIYDFLVRSVSEFAIRKRLEIKRIWYDSGSQKIAPSSTFSKFLMWPK